MPNFKYIILEIKDQIAKITLNRPEKRNAMSSDVLHEIDAALDHILSSRRNKDTAARVVLFCGAGDHFTGGADIREMRGLDNIKAYEFSRLGQYISQKLERFPLPIIAVIQGYCVGGGIELTSACDMRIASKDAIFGQPEINIGIVTGWGSSQRLPRIVGISKAKELMYTGKMITADEAYNIRLIDMVVPRNKLESTALEIAEQIKSKPSAAIAAAKETVLQASLLPLDAGLEFERKAFGALFGTHDQIEAMSAFLEKRKAKFTDTVDDFFNLNKFPWKSGCASNGSPMKTPAKQTSTSGSGKASMPFIMHPFMMPLTGLWGSDENSTIFSNHLSNPLFEQWMDMQKAGASIMQKQMEIMLGNLMDVSKLIPKWLK